MIMMNHENTSIFHGETVTLLNFSSEKYIAAFSKKRELSGMN